MSTQTIAVVSAGLSEPSSTKLLADRLRDATLAALAEQGSGADPLDVVLRPLATDIASNLVTRQPTRALSEVFRKVTEADAIIAVTPTFTMSYSGLFKSFFDGIEEGSLASIPTALGATGGSARHSMMLEHAMRPMFAYLKAQVVPTGVFAANEDWGADEGLQRRIEREGGELAALMTALPRRPASDPFNEAGAGFQSFEQLLGRG